MKILFETKRHMQEIFDSFKIATGLKMARAAVGWSQVEMAEKLGMAKTTLARAETAEGGLRADQLAPILRFFKALGVELDLFSEEHVQVKIDQKGLELALTRLQDDAHRRSDRKKSSVIYTFQTSKASVTQSADKSAQGKTPSTPL